MANPLETFKLQKLVIQSFANAARTGTATRFEVPFNPSSLSMSYNNTYTRSRGLSARPPRFVRTDTGLLTLDLVFDGTGVADLGVAHLPGASAAASLLPGPLASALSAQAGVAKTVEAFLRACYLVKADTHEPAYLRLNWGQGPLKKFDCRLGGADISYTAFARDGSPLRATVAARFVEASDPKKAVRELSLNSPDITHGRTVAAGDTLPLLCAEVYGTVDQHAAVGRANDLDRLRELVPGTQLLLPPLED